MTDSQVCAIVAHMQAFGFSQTLRAAMEKQGVTGRELGRRLRPDLPEHGRRMVVAYLSATAPVLPRRKRRAELAAALGLPDDAFEEDDPVASRLSMIEALMREIRELSTPAMSQERTG